MAGPINKEYYDAKIAHLKSELFDIENELAKLRTDLTQKQAFYQLKQGELKAALEDQNVILKYLEDQLTKTEN